MGAASELSRARLWDRLIALALFVPSSAVLGLAAWLTPIEEGTHQQLGLGDCIMHSVTGWPCPMCGMTTTFAYMAHGDVVSALGNQPFGVVLFLATVLTAIISMVEMVLPRRRWLRIWDWIGPKEGSIAGAILVGLILGWLYKIFKVVH